MYKNNFLRGIRGQNSKAQSPIKNKQNGIEHQCYQIVQQEMRMNTMVLLFFFFLKKNNLLSITHTEKYTKFKCDI